MRATASPSCFSLSMLDPESQGKAVTLKDGTTMPFVPHPLEESRHAPRKRWSAPLPFSAPAFCDCTRGVRLEGHSVAFKAGLLKMIQLLPCEPKCLGLESRATIAATSLLRCHHAVRMPRLRMEPNRLYKRWRRQMPSQSSRSSHSGCNQAKVPALGWLS